MSPYVKHSEDEAIIRRWRKIRQAALERARRALRVIRRHKTPPPAKPQPAPAAGPSRMYDSIYPSRIPADAPAVAGYVGGHWPTFAGLAARFPNAQRVSIAVASRYDAEILDVEPGDATPAVAPEWVKRQLARGVKKPGIYCSVSAARDVLDRLAASGIKRSQIRLWTAHYTHKPHLCGPECGFGMPTRADATQFTNQALGNLDESLCASSFWEGR